MRRRDFLIGGASAITGAAVTGAGLYAYNPGGWQADDDLSAPTEPPSQELPLYLSIDPSSYAVVTDEQFGGGADATGVDDSTGAFRAAAESGQPIYLPPGRYRFDGPALDLPSPRVVGAGQGATVVTLSPDTYFLDSDRRWPQLLLQGIRFKGGMGHVRNRSTDVNVNDLFVVTDCSFVDYSTASISTHSTDHPYWKIQRNIFQSSNCTSSVGVSLSGLTDGTTISDNEFLTNRIHIRLDRGGNNTYIYNNDFLRFRPYDGVPRIDVWFVPAPTDVNSGAGMVITRCKFGNEGLDARDFRIVYADESAADLVGGGRWPVLDQESGGWIAGHTVDSVLTNGIGDRSPIPLIRSTTSKIIGGHYGPITQAGNSGAPIMSSMRPLQYQSENTFGPLLRASYSIVPPMPLVVHDE